MTKMLLVAVAVTMLCGFALAQDRRPGNEGAIPAPGALQNAPPDKVAPGPPIPPDTVPPDAKAETASPALKMDSATDKKMPAVLGTSTGEMKRP